MNCLGKGWGGLLLASSFFCVGCAEGEEHREASEAEGDGGEAVAMLPPPVGSAWSDPATWGGTKPGAGDDVTIPEGREVVLDESPPALGSLRIDGALRFGLSDLQLRAGYVLVHGTLEVGSRDLPFPRRATITLDGDDTAGDVMGMGTRGLLVMGGRVVLHGTSPDVAWTRLAEHAPAGATDLVLAEPVDWREGDDVVVAPTDFYGLGETERIALASADGTGVALVEGLATSRWGVLQYATDRGMSLTDEGRIEPPSTPTPTVLDERAEVANLTRGIVIEGVDDALWHDDGFGAHVMVMDLESEVVIDGVELRRVGQRGRLGRYPMHWHRLSYAEDGVELGDAEGHVIRRSTVTGSENRCIVVHATNGVTVEDNVCFGVRGHGVFLEDAVERRNVVSRNIVLSVRNPGAPLKVHEGPVFQGGSSAFWITNPDNAITGNVAVDAEGVGFWLSFPERPLGPSANVPLQPYVMPFGVFDDNTAHSNQKFGLNLDWAVTDDAGNVTPLRYSPTSDMVPDRFDNWATAVLHRFTTYKHLEGGIWNRVSVPEYVEFVSADNDATFFDGAGANGLITRALLVGKSLNSEQPNPVPDRPPVAFATYHSTFDMTDNVVVGFAFVPGLASGAFKTDDYYVRAVDKGMIRNADNLLVDAHPGYRAPRGNPAFALAGALWDPHGYFGPAGRFWTYDDPFLTYGTLCEPVEPVGQNGQSCEGPYYGIGGFVLEQANERFEATMAIDVTRQDDGGATIGAWSVLEGGEELGNMRHFAALRGGIYVLEFPGRPAPADVGLTIDNAASPEESFVIAVQFGGRNPAHVYTATDYDYQNVAAEPVSASKEDYGLVADRAAVLASDGGVFFQDAANGLVWIKIHGGLEDRFVESTDPRSDERLYEPMYLRVH